MLVKRKRTPKVPLAINSSSPIDCSSVRLVVQNEDHEAG